MKDLKEKSIRGGLAKACGQMATLVLGMTSLMVLARILDPKDFGLVGMVTAVTGAFNLLKDFGLSTATIQRATITDEQVSTLFWINILVGAILCLLLLAAAPFVAAFYHEPRLVAVTAALAFGFVFNAAGVQHSALLQRQMRFTALSAIDIGSLLVSVGVGIGLAISGLGYWALVAMAVSLPLVTTICLWLSTRWLPGKPRRQAGVRSMLRFGGTITLNGVVVYLGYNLEKILLGRFWGAESVGIYGRAYQLITIPKDGLNSAIGGVAFSALSRIQNDPGRFKSYFLKSYSPIVAINMLIAAGCALFADDLILVVLGSKWTETAVILRSLSPLILIFALINPMGWLLFAAGLVGRSLKISLVLAPLMMLGYVLGLPYGPKGVALGYSAMMTLWVVPHIAWCVHGTVISLRDIARTVLRPLLSIVPAAPLAFGVQFFFGNSLSPLYRLVLEGTLLVGTYAVMLLYVMGQKAFYLDLFGGLWGRSPSVDPKTLVPA